MNPYDAAVKGQCRGETQIVNSTRKQKNLKLVLELSDIWRRYDQVYSRWAERHGLSTNAMSLIEELHIRPEGMEPAVLADYLGIPRQTMTSTLDGLEAKGVIERCAHPTDRRRKLIKLTPDGRQKADDLVEAMHRWVMGAISSVPPDEGERALALARLFCQRLEGTL